MNELMKFGSRERDAAAPIFQGWAVLGAPLGLCSQGGEIPELEHIVGWGLGAQIVTLPTMVGDTVETSGNLILMPLPPNGLPRFAGASLGQK
jgi:hypothetical protein